MNLQYKTAYCLFVFLLVAMFVACGSGGGDEYGGGISGQQPGGQQSLFQRVLFDLEWGAPTKDEDGGPLTGLSGYFVYYGSRARSGDDPKLCDMCGYTAKVDVRNALSSAVSIPKGRYYFAITAYDSAGNESAFSAEVGAYK
jgi:hypothetical protein